MIIVHGPHLKMQHKVNFLSKCISLFFQTPPWSPFFTSLKHRVVVYFGHGTISKRFIPKDKSTQKKITKQKIESKYFMCDAAPFFFFSVESPRRVIQPGVSKASNPQHKSISYADRSLRCTRRRANTEQTVQCNLEHTKVKCLKCKLL